MVKISYGEVGKSSSKVEQSTDKVCYDPFCKLEDASITYQSFELNNEGNGYLWTFETDVTPNKWCYELETDTCVIEPISGAKWCTKNSVM